MEHQRRTITVKIASKKKTQNLGIYLTMEVKGLYTEHNKMLIKELEDYSKKSKDIPCF